MGGDQEAPQKPATDCPELVANPEPALAQLKATLGDTFTAGPAAAACVKPNLHRNR